MTRLSRKLWKWWYRFTDDNQMIGFKLTMVLIIMVAGMQIDKL